MMNQRYHVVFKKGEVTVRRQWKGKDVELYSSGGVPKKGIPAMFGKHEERQFLENLGPFVVASIDKPEIARQILEEGYVVEDPDTKSRSKWYVAGYFVRDDGSVFVMTPQPTTDVQFFNHLGLRIDMENKWGNSFKVGKYLKRLFSHHRKFLQGTVIADHGDVILVRYNNKVLSIRYADYGKLTDGMNLVSTHCMKVLGLKKSVGQGLRITALSPKGFSKGHAIVLSGLQHDLVLFNSKKLLYSTGDKFTFAMDWLHSGALFTDVQSVINFRLYNGGFLQTWAELFMNEVIDALQDEEKLRKMLQFYSIDFHKHQRGEQAGEYIEKAKDWALLRALRGGVGHKPHPALVRKIYHLFADKVMKCENDIRIPIPEAVAGARYAIVDPTIFDELGNPTREGELRGNTVYCPDHLGDVVFHRQPNAHRGEHHIAKAVKSEYLESIDNGCFMFMSKDMVADSLGKLGGGDQDDRLVYYKDPVIVEHFKQLEEYPVVHEVKQAKPILKPNVFKSRLLRTPVYDRAQLLMMLDQQKKQGVSIGYVVNAVMLDTLLTDQKNNILQYMRTQLPQDQKVMSAIEWMEAYAGYTLRGPASKLEIVIDGVKKEGNDLADIGHEIKQFNDSFMVIPDFCTRGGDFGGRIPQSRRGETHPVIVFTFVETMLLEISNMRKDLEDIVTDISWQMLQPVPLEVLTQPTRDGSYQLACAIQDYYRMQWANLSKEIPATNDKAAVKKTIEAYIKIDESVFNQFKANPLIVDAFVQLYHKIYDNRAPEAPRDENGRARRFGDGILWGPMLSGFTMRALELCNLAGRYTEAQYYPEFKQLNREIVYATIDSGVVTQEGTNAQVGMCDPMADGKQKTIEKGLVFVPASDAYPYEPQERLQELVVVNGMSSRSVSDRAEWKSHDHEQVRLIPYIYNNNGVDEHAVHVMLGAREFGALQKSDAIYVTRECDGWLQPGNTPNSMKVVVKEERQ